MKALARIAALELTAGAVLAMAAPDAPTPDQPPKREPTPAPPAAAQPQAAQPRPFKAAPPALRPPPQKTPSLVTVDKIPNQNAVTPGVYLASPYTGIVVVPPDIDPKFAVGVGDSRVRMPGVEAPLTLKPRNQPVPKPAEGPAPQK